MNFSIITPSYNRENYLHILYDSLKKQGNESFEWIVIDDGSTDDTKKLIKSFIDENNEKKLFSIKYFYQSNGGKHRAVNRGIKAAKGKYITIIDSDDQLVPNGILFIHEIIRKYDINNDDEIICISAAKVDKKGKVVSFLSQEDNERMSHYDWFYLNKRVGDRIDFYKSNVMKDYFFNDFCNERFLTEDTLWLKMKGFKLYINEVVLIVDYLDGGLTSNYQNLLKNNPFGMSYYHFCLLNNSHNKYIALKSSVLLLYYVLIAIIKNTSIINLFFTLILSPLVCLIKYLKK